MTRCEKEPIPESDLSPPKTG